MEPVLDLGNEKEVPVAVWSDECATQGTEKNWKSPLQANGKLNDAPSIVIFESEAKGDTLKTESLFSCASSCGSSNNANPKNKKKPKVPDGGWGWIVVIASFVVSMIADGISFSFGLLYIEFLNYFQESKSKTSWIGSLFMAVPLLSGPIMSALVDRYGCRSMTILGGFISGLGFVVASFGNSIEWEFVFFGVVAGIGLGLCYVTAVVSVAYWFDKYRTLAIGLGACGTGVGTFVYAPLTQYLIEEYGWRGTVLLLAGTLFNMCVCGALMRDPDWLTKEQYKQGSLKNAASSSTLRESEGDLEISQSPKNSNSFDRISERGKIEKEIDGMTKSKESLPSFRSEVNLPTYFTETEKVPCEVAEELRANKIRLNILLKSHPFLSRDDGETFKASAKDKPLSSILVSDAFGQRKFISGNSSVVLSIGENLPTKIKRNQTLKAPLGKEKVQNNIKDLKFHRNSVIYRGARLNIPRYRSRASSCPDVFRNPISTTAEKNEEKWYTDSLELFKTMFDFSMFVELHFLLMSLATIILFIWLIVPYFYLAEHVTRHGYAEVEASFLLSIIGIANCFGMVGLGWAGDQPWINVTKTYALCLTLCGLTCLFMPVTTDRFNVLAALSALFGLFFASNYSFTPSIVVNLISLERFTTAYGLILLCQGIGCLVGPPLAGWIFDVMDEWDLSFYLAGGWIIFSAVLTILIDYTKNRRIFGAGQLTGEKT